MRTLDTARACSLAAGLVLAACSSTEDAREVRAAEPAAPASAGARAPEAAVPAPEVDFDEKQAILTTRHFAVHSDPLVNAHHFLYQWARADAPPNRGDRRRPVAVHEREAVEYLTAETREALALATADYGEHAIARDLLFDPEMKRLGLALTKTSRVEDVEFGELAELADGLAAFEPVYRERFWPDHSRANTEWIGWVAGLLILHEHEVAEALAHAYGAPWPDTPIRVDATYYGNWAGGYTSHEPDHITIATGDPENQERGSLEILFHEASHAENFTVAIHTDLETAFEAHGAEPPPMLWHALMFFTAGELVRRAYVAEGVDDYEPYAYRTGLYERTRWDRFLPALEEHWIAFLDGEIDREEAYARVAEALAE